MNERSNVGAECLADQLLGAEEHERERPRIRAAIHPAIERFLENKDLVFSLVDGLGSPLNVMFPRHITETIQKFEKVYRDRFLRGRIFYTSKPNKSHSLKRQAALSTVGLDVSSEGELAHGLACGFNPERIEATGPKNEDYIALGVQQGIIFNADNLQELRQIAAMARQCPTSPRVRVMVRLDGFRPERVSFSAQDSAFGTRVEDASEIIDFLQEKQDILDFQGFSFHFNAGDNVRRPPAIEKCLELTFACIEKGLRPKGINIGGGYRISYAASREEWNIWIEELKASVLGRRPSLSWNHSGLGYSTENGVLRGAPNFMEHFYPGDGASDLASVIDTRLPLFDNQSLSQILSDSLLELYVEPGRALLDQCGITLARVNFVKTSMRGESLVMLDMNRTNMNATQLKLLTDPIVVYRDSGRTQAEDGVFYVGNLCLTHDMIQYHKSFPTNLPQTGDVVAFINTAAYQMDFAESNVLRQRTAEKVAIVQDNHQIRWYRDELFNPLSRV